MNHANLPTIATATLPQTYQAAQTALAACANVDECQDWADKAQALASYARQAGDDTLRKMAERIQARAIRREGELFKLIDKAHGANQNIKGDDSPKVLTRKAAAEQAGISQDQMKTAIRVANLDPGEFEAAVESDDPPTVTALAEAGTIRKPQNIIDLKGRDPDEFNAALHFVGALREMAGYPDKWCKNADYVLGILTPTERERARKYIGIIDVFTDSIITRL